MKTKYFLSAILLTPLFMVGCADEEAVPTPDYLTKRPASEEAYLYLNEYKPLKSYIDREAYPNFKLGIALPAADFNSKGLLYRMAINNFDEVVATSAMNMNSCYSFADNALTSSMGTVESFVTSADGGNVSVMGPALVSNVNQTKGWLESLLKDNVEIRIDTIKGAGGDEIVPELPQLDEENGNNALEVINAEVKGDTYGTQLFYVLPEPMKSGTTYTLSMDVWLENALNEDLGFWPYAAGAGTQYTGFGLWEGIPAGYKFQNISMTFTASGDHTFLQFPIGHINGKMYIDNVSLVEQGKTTNLVNNGSFDEPIEMLTYGNYGNEGAIAPDTWWCWSWAAPAVKNFKVKSNIVSCLKVNNPEIKGDTYGTQLFYVLPEPMTAGTDYTLTMKVRLNKELNEGLGFWPYAAGAGTQYTGFDKNPIPDAEWVTLTCNFTASGDHTFLQFPIGHINGIMRIDDVCLVKAGTTTNLVNNGNFDEPIELLNYSAYGNEGAIAPDTWWTWSWAAPTAVVELYENEPKIISGADKIVETEIFTPLTEKERIDTLSYAMNSWINDILKASHGNVKAWDVLSDVMSEDGSGIQTVGGDNDFCWAAEMGETEFVQTAVRLTRQNFESLYGDSIKLTLFINESGLEAEGNAKLKGLINGLKNWETSDVKIDGIGASLHLNCYEDKKLEDAEMKNIETMLGIMAESGKLVRLSLLDMNYISASGNIVTLSGMTFDKEQEIADLYKKVIKAYLSKVPANLQYGITVWPMTDNKESGNPAGIWTDGNDRKPAYAGFADGLQNK